MSLKATGKVDTSEEPKCWTMDIEDAIYGICTVNHIGCTLLATATKGSFKGHCYTEFSG